MSVEQAQRAVNQIDKEIADLEKKMADLVKKEADKTKKIGARYSGKRLQSSGYLGTDLPWYCR